MTESLEVRLARIEVKLDAHFSRDDERAVKWEGHEERIQALEAAENQRKGSRTAMAALFTFASVVGGLVVKLWPFGAK